MVEELANDKTFKEYLFFWVGQLFSLLGSMVVLFVIIWWIADVFESEILLAVASFLATLTFIISMPIAGVLADKLNRKLVILIADSLQAFLTFFLIIMITSGLADIGLVLLFISLRSTCQAFHAPIVSAIIPTMVPKDKLSRINGVNFLFTGVVQLLAPFIGATLLIFLSIQLILWVDIVTFFIALVPLLLIAIPNVNGIQKAEETTEKMSFIKDFKLGFKTMKIVPGLIIMTILSMLLNFLLRPIDALMPLFIKVNHGGGPELLAFSEMVFTGGLIAGAILTSIKKNWNNKIRVIFIGIIGAMIGYMIFALAPSGSILILGLGGTILGFNLPIVNSLYKTFVQLTVPADKLGRVSSINSSLGSAISPIGSLVSGPLAVFMGIPILYLACGLIGTAITIAFWSFTGIRKIDLDNLHTSETINEQLDSIMI